MTGNHLFYRMWPVAAGVALIFNVVWTGFHGFGAVMQSFSPKSATERPPCPKCGASMSLTRIVPKKLGINQRPYECVMCGYEETFSVPFKSAFAKQARLSWRPL